MKTPLKPFVLTLDAPEALTLLALMQIGSVTYRGMTHPQDPFPLTAEVLAAATNRLDGIPERYFTRLSRKIEAALEDATGVPSPRPPVTRQ